MLSQASLKLHSHTQSTLTQPGLTTLSPPTQSLTQPTHAYESVLRGVLHALRDQRCVDEPLSQRVLSLAVTHCEPSLAATLTARSVVGEQVDRFVWRVVREKYKDVASPEKVESAVEREGEDQESVL